MALEDGWFEARPPADGESNQVVDIDNVMQDVADMDDDNNAGAA